MNGMLCLANIQYSKIQLSVFVHLCPPLSTFVRLCPPLSVFVFVYLGLLGRYKLLIEAEKRHFMDEAFAFLRLRDAFGMRSGYNYPFYVRSSSQVSPK